MKVFKFGGASIKNAEAVRNVGLILSRYSNDNLIVIVSAMGKTTNLLEKAIHNYWNEVSTTEILNEFKEFHNLIISDLELSSLESINNFYKKLEEKLNSKKSDNFHFEYDQIICFGELLSTTILFEYLNKNTQHIEWLDARSIVKTDSKWCEAKVDWLKTENQYNTKVKIKFDANCKTIITQGFIGATTEGLTTSLGREGSDFSAAIFAFISNSENVTIWKDVPGMLNADPRIFNGTILLKQISFREAIELAYFGASVIHPKTIQPLKNKEIPLYIKSFLNPDSKGTVIQSSMEYDSKVASYIFKSNQVLLSLIPKDFSFVVEDNLKEIFGILSDLNIRVNLMQNSAVSFSFLTDDKYNLDELLNLLSPDYSVKYNKNVELLTIRHYNDDTIGRLTQGKTIILEQKTRQTARLVLKPV
jgi:aspartate kinase